MILLMKSEIDELKELIENHIKFLHERHDFGWAAELPNVAFRFIDIDKMLELYK